MTATTKNATPKTMPCPRCDGKKTIEGFSHVANGVCFKCGGSGVVKFRKASPPRPMTEYQIAVCERIIAITDEELAGLSYGELLKLRDNAHWHYPLYPNLLAVWRSKGEAHFQEAQAQRLAAAGY